MKKLKRFVAVTAAVCTACLTFLPVMAEDGSGGTPPVGNAPGNPPGEPGEGGGADTASYDYSGTLSGTKTADGSEVTSDSETLDSSTADQNTALAENGGTLTITNGTLTKSGDDTNGDNCNFYGLNSIALASGENSLLKLSGSSLNAGSEGSNGVFATDSAAAYVYNTTITTSAGNSRGLDATYGGTILASDVTISTQGDHSASLATDRGGGNVSLVSGTLNTAGSGSPLLYSTGDIEVDGVSGTATGSQIAGMEGLNTILIYNSDLTSTQTAATASDPIADGVIIYQSTSGDAETATSEKAVFNAVNSTLSSSIASGTMFYVTNTNANIVLSNTKLNFDSDAAALLTAQGNDSNNWGTAGSNGGNVTFTALGETLSGNITADTISTIDLYLLDGSTWTGSASITANSVNTSASDAPITINVGSDSTWVVTDSCEISNLNVAEGGKVVDSNGKTVTITNNGNTVVQGDSDITVNVTGSYGTAVTTDSDNELTTSYIDRTAFDSAYGTSTTFAAASTEEKASASPVSTSDTEAVSEAEDSASHTPLVIGVCVIAAIIVIAVMAKRKKH
ncbi:MAG: hypothetical protein LKE64_12450 [Solobacterium sp.]|jgi:hypothetical protein|nr:hypothetical protein [Solobacterium sp.]MCH4048066.1 hypothetical protein [Solobacterium sp.]MCH4075080.1 hypothetical protein [Solobacterium sp.]MCI1313989.1 hypothetical protein [Solobacterium sp.]MCI1347048.1 hypothetical protein [Solobacterium sp.]